MYLSHPNNPSQHQTPHRKDNRDPGGKRALTVPYGNIGRGRRVFLGPTGGVALRAQPPANVYQASGLDVVGLRRARDVGNTV